MSQDTINLLVRLDALGSPDNIARFFHVNGITGNPLHGSSCPVANYLRARGERGVSVSPYNRQSDLVSYWFGLAGNDRYADVSAENVANFMSDFDDLGYPDLLPDAPLDWPGEWTV